MKTLGIAMPFREINGELLNIDDIYIRYYISSASLAAEQFAQASRELLAIEN